MISFNKHLSARIQEKDSQLCVGLDISPEALKIRVPTLNKLIDHTKKIIDSTHDLVAAYKPNLAFFERWGSEGFKWLEETLSYIGPTAIIIGDAKRGDIGNTAQQYAISLFDHFGFDAVTVNPYMGAEALTPFLARADKGAFILCRTSNQSAGFIQDISHDGLSVFEHVAQLGMKLNKLDNVGLVVGATAPKEIKKVRECAPDLPLLIPGVGAQGGDLKNSLIEGSKTGETLISISRRICFSGDLSNKAIRSAAKEYLLNMRAIQNEN